MAAWPAPQPLDVVWCLFPYGGHPTAERHPCLILSVTVPTQDAPVFVVVAGGTSANKQGQWNRQPKPTDWLLQQPGVLRQAGLTNPTLFQFEGVQQEQDGSMSGGTLLTLPYTDDFFVVIPPAFTPVIGRIDLSNAQTMAAFVAAGKAANLNMLLEKEKVRYTKAPDITTMLS